jgi:hypothetical protein
VHGELPYADVLRYGDGRPDLHEGAMGRASAQRVLRVPVHDAVDADGGVRDHAVQRADDSARSAVCSELRPGVVRDDHWREDVRVRSVEWTRIQRMLCVSVRVAVHAGELCCDGVLRWKRARDDVRSDVRADRDSARILRDSDG